MALINKATGKPIKKVWAINKDKTKYQVDVIYNKSGAKIIFGGVTLSIVLSDRYAYVPASSVHFYVYAAVVQASLTGNPKAINSLNQDIVISWDAKGGSFADFSGFSKHNYSIVLKKGHTSGAVSWNSQGKRIDYIPPRYEIARNDGLGVGTINITSKYLNISLSIDRNANNAPYKKYSINDPIDTEKYRDESTYICIS